MLFSNGSLSWFHIILFLAIVIVGIVLARITKFKTISWITCMFMVCVAGLRHGYIDTRAYRQGFEDLDVSYIFSSKFFESDSKDKGFSVLSAIIKIFTENSQVFLFVLSLLTVGFLFWGIVKRVPNFDIGVFLFVTTGCFLDTMNGIRQTLVLAILFYFAPDLIQKKKFVKYLILVLLLSTVHSSALIFLILYFIANRPPWSKATAMILVVLFFVYLSYNLGLSRAFFNLLEDTQYGDDYGEMIMAGNTSVNIIRPFIAAVPLVLSYFTKSRDKSKHQYYNIAFNMSIMGFGCWLMSTKVLYFYRLAAYFTPYSILLLCYDIVSLGEFKNKKNLYFIYFAMIFLYLIYHIYSLYVTGSNLFVGYLKY